MILTFPIAPNRHRLVVAATGQLWLKFKGTLLLGKLAHRLYSHLDLSEPVNRSGVRVTYIDARPSEINRSYGEKTLDLH